MFSLRNAPIKRKLMLVILMTTTFALMLMAGAIVVYESITFRATITSATHVLAQVVGTMSTAPLKSGDREEATEVLNVLSAEPQITAAVIYDREGKSFARFSSGAADERVPATPQSDSSLFKHSQLEVFREIIDKGEVLGTIYIRADLREMYQRLWTYGGIVLLAGFGSIGLAVAGSTIMQRRISKPIVELADTAQAVSENQDYSVRATKHGEDEIGELTDAFNQMLTRVGEVNAALTGSEERLRLALEGSETGTWDWDLESGKLLWDEFMLPLYGITPEQWQGTQQNWLALIHPEDRGKVLRRIAEALELNRDLNTGFRVIGATGKVRHMATRGRVFHDETGRAVRMSGVSMDVTVTKQSEEALQKAKDEAEAANRAKDEFLAILSHELRTPLTPVLTTVAMLQEETPAESDLHHELETIRRNVEVEARLIDDLLDLTRISRGKLELHEVILDLRTLLNHAVCNYLQKQAAQKSLKVVVEIDEKAETSIEADGPRITQVLWNLMQNACKFTPEGGAITIRVYNEPREDALPEVVVEVQDTGIGIAADLLPRIFDAFEQGERSRTRVFGGLGLGLAISQAIAERHGGTLTASSPGRDRGATFTLRLPTCAANTPAVASESPPAKSTEPKDARTGRILLVEDHADTARQLSRLLTRAGHQVSCAGSVAEAKTQYAPDQFDLLLSDLGLPDGSGHEVMRHIRDLQQTIPGIALSGYGMEEDVKVSLQAGFNRHLTKPVHWPELKAVIEELLPLGKSVQEP